MKKIILILLVFITIISCKTADTDFTKSDLNSISLYDFDNKPISVEEITNQWNERIQESEEINARITKLEITNLTDLKTNKNELVLLGNTNRKSVKTATKLTRFKNGLKLNEISVTCKNCESELNIKLNSGKWSCLNEKELNSCTKIETMRGI
ncbi:hypothetical protein [Mangrovimonas cancribranchiae]|uniref:Lipoprotein n=1 Tax=Mangrovimonas cancribranchiae TaxID=3080055 RepID=A0AAU6NXZ9_9FLAO